MSISLADLNAKPSAQHLFTGEGVSDVVYVQGRFNYSVIPVAYEGGSPATPWSGTVTLQRGFLNSTEAQFANFIPPGELIIWQDVATHTGAFEGYDNSPYLNVYRMIVKSGQYASGKLIARFGL